MVVFLVVGPQKDQLGAFFSGLPHGLGGLDFELFRRLVLGQDDPVAAGGIAAHRHRPVPELRMVQQLHRGVEAVQITMQDNAVHGVTSFFL